MPQQKILPGMVLFDRYLVQVVGRGRSTQVRLLQALDQQRVELVAIKIQPLDVGQREAALLERLAHPHLVRYLAHHVMRETSYLVEAWVEGERLEHLKGTCSPAQVVRIGEQLADVLAHLHAQRVVHADLDGQNVLVDTAGRVIVLDLGLAQEFAPDDPDLAYWVDSEVTLARELLANLLERTWRSQKKRLRLTRQGRLSTVLDLRASLEELSG
jgi:serine/threonine protein kinase